MDERTCTQCAQTRPLAEFSKDARAKSGRRGVCKICERTAIRSRRADARIGRRPGALVLAPNFPTPSESPSPPGGAPAAPDQTRSPDGVGNTTYAEAAEDFIGALDPPAGKADALLLRNLRGLAAIADVATWGQEPAREIPTLTTALIRAQRELAATRMAKAKPVSEATAPSTRRASNY